MTDDENKQTKKPAPQPPGHAAQQPAHPGQPGQSGQPGNPGQQPGHQPGQPGQHPGQQPTPPRQQPGQQPPPRQPGQPGHHPDEDGDDEERDHRDHREAAKRNEHPQTRTGEPPPQGKPTPTQDENDRTAMGEHVIEHEDDGSGPDPNAPADKARHAQTQTRQVEAGRGASYKTK